MDVKLKRRLNVRHAADEMSRGAHMGCRGQKTGTHWLTVRSRENKVWARDVHGARTSACCVCPE